MNIDKFITPKDIKVGERVFIISKIPAIESLGIYNIIADSVNKFGIVGVTMIPYGTVKQILSYTALCDSDGTKMILSNDPIITETFKNDIGELQQLLVAMVKENYDFFVSGKLLDLLLPPPEKATE